MVTTGRCPAPGVSISASSPSLQGLRTTVTGEGGGYYLPNLPPGQYVITFDLAGMQRLDKRVTINVSQTSKADVDMRVSAAAESITVTASAPAVAETTEIASNFTSQQINELPIGRTIDDVTRLAPGVNEAGPNNQIVDLRRELVRQPLSRGRRRGEREPARSAHASRRGRGPGDHRSSGASPRSSAASPAEWSTSITKSGGNDFSGSLRDSLTNPNWADKTAYAAQTDPIDQINNQYEGTFGGRIIRDRLWFFGAGRYTKADTSKQTAFTNTPYVLSSDDRRFEAKLTGQVTPKHSLVGSYISSKEHQNNHSSGGTILDLRSLAPYERPRNLLSLNYSGILTNSLLIEGQYSRMNDQFTEGGTSRDLVNGTIPSMMMTVCEGGRRPSAVCAPRRFATTRAGWARPTS